MPHLAQQICNLWELDINPLDQCLPFLGRHFLEPFKKFFLFITHALHWQIVIGAPSRLIRHKLALSIYGFNITLITINSYVFFGL